MPIVLKIASKTSHNSRRGLVVELFLSYIPLSAISLNEILLVSQEKKWKK